MPNVFSPRDLVSRPDNMDETVLHTNESVILNVLQFPMKKIYQSCDLGRAIGKATSANNVICLLTFE